MGINVDVRDEVLKPSHPGLDFGVQNLGFGANVWEWIDSGLVERGNRRAEYVQGTPDQSGISPNTLVYKDDV